MLCDGFFYRYLPWVCVRSRSTVLRKPLLRDASPALHTPLQSQIRAQSRALFELPAVAEVSAAEINATGSSTAPLGAAGQSLLLGEEMPNGYVSEAVYYSRALTGAEVRLLALKVRRDSDRSAVSRLRTCAIKGVVCCKVFSVAGPRL